MTKQTADAEKAARIASQIGDPEGVARDLARVREAAKVFSSDHRRLIEEYPEKWVAVYNEHVLARDSLDELLDVLESSGIPREHAVVRFIDKDEKVFVL